MVDKRHLIRLLPNFEGALTHLVTLCCRIQTFLPIKEDPYFVIILGLNANCQGQYCVFVYLFYCQFFNELTSCDYR